MKSTRVVYFIDQDGEISSSPRNELIRRYAEETTTPLGVDTKYHLRENELWSWGVQGNFPKMVAIYESKDQAEEALWVTFEHDFFDSSEAPQLFDSYQAADNHRNQQ
jgi:hypothetical protein